MHIYSRVCKIFKPFKSSIWRWLPQAPRRTASINAESNIAPQKSPLLPLENFSWKLKSQYRREHQKYIRIDMLAHTGMNFIGIIIVNREHLKKSVLKGFLLNYVRAHNMLYYIWRSPLPCWSRITHSPHTSSMLRVGLILKSLPVVPLNLPA